ncbi:MAG: EAL domain-containing protein, partial [Burkholderiaceae bacterium]|nr:EAL domain-containing protein [Burkholderiaceae bacterium]
DISDSGFSTPPIERARRYGWRSAAALPLSRKGRIVGAFVLYASEANAFDQEACNLLQEMALDISFAMDNFIQEKAHREAQHQLQLAGEVFEQSREGFMITGPNGNIQLVNRAFTEITGFSCNDVLGKTPHILSSGHQDEQFYRAMWASLNTQGCWQGEVLNRKKDGSLYLAWLAISKITGKDGSAAQYIGIHSDITQYKANEDRMNWLAHFDTLTGLPNRTLLEDRSRQAIGITQRSGKPMAVMFLDLDHFKNINDSLGYRIGDTLLAMLAKRLQSVLQEKDTLSRFGGDSFLILLPGVEANEAAHLARKLLAAVEPPYRIKQHELAITASIGVAMCPDNGQDLESLSKCADAAMYRAKQDGRNTFCFFTKEMQANVSRELLLENALRRALERQQLALHYQPQMSLKDGNIVGAEALLRWQHPEFGMIPPDEFIPIAESHGMIQAIGEWVLKTALHQFKLWMDQGLRLTSIAVNLSALQLRDANLPERVMQILEEAGVPAQYLELELTESAMMEDPGQAMALMEKLHSHGIRMSIDDFGTGYSSLGHLKRFNAYKLKIDRSFVRDIPDDIDDKALVNAIIKMADSLGLHTIAEGVETEEQLNFLRKNGCDEIQGYYCSRPLPVQQFGTLLQQQLPPKFGDTVHAR